MEKKPRKRGQNRVPPPLVRGDERMDGTAILSEFEGDAAILIWKSLLNLLLVAEHPARCPDDLFAPDTSVRRIRDLRAVSLDPVVAAPLTEIATTLTGPGLSNQTRLADASNSVSAWALGQGATGTALLFGQASALLAAGDAPRAVEVGRLARLHGDGARAESWYWEAIARARQAQEWRAYVLAYIGLGKVYVQRGTFPAARRAFARAARRARRQRFHDLYGWALHDQAAIAIQSHDWATARRFVPRAINAFSGNPALVPRLIHDVAFGLMEAGYFGPALPVFKELAAVAFPPRDRLLLLSSLARAAGALGQEEDFDRAWIEASRLVDEPETAKGAAGALLEITRGAANLRRWDLALSIGLRAQALAETRGEAKVRLELEAVLDQVARRTALEGRPEASVPPVEIVELAEDLLSSAHKLAGAAQS